MFNTKIDESSTETLGSYVFDNRVSGEVASVNVSQEVLIEQAVPMEPSFTGSQGTVAASTPTQSPVHMTKSQTTASNQ